MSGNPNHSFTEGAANKILPENGGSKLCQMAGAAALALALSVAGYRLYLRSRPPSVVKATMEKIRELEFSEFKSAERAEKLQQILRDHCRVLVRNVPEANKVATVSKVWGSLQQQEETKV